MIDKEELFKKVKLSYYAIINSLEKEDKQKRESYAIVPDFSIPNQISSKRITKQEYATHIYLNMVSLEKFSELRELLKYLNENCGLNQNFIDKLVEELFNTLLYSCREKSCENEIKVFIDLFYNDLVKNPIKYHIKGYYIGISLADDIYNIDENIILRKADPFDFESRDIGEYNNKLDRFTFQFPPVILEYTYLSSRNIETYEGYHIPPELVKELLFIDWSLLLFRSAPVFRIQTESEVKSLFVRGKSISGDFTLRRLVDKFNLNKENINDLKKFISIFKTPEIRKIFEAPPNKPNHIIIALNRYYNAYLYSENISQKVTSLISCLEALLSEGAQELKRTLCQRVSIVLKSIGYNALTINEDINLAYRIRNKYSHGSAINLKKVIKQNINNFINNLIEYTRLCFLISMQIHPVKTKKEYLKLIDLSLLDEKLYSELMKIIKENCMIFND